MDRRIRRKHRVDGRRDNPRHPGRYVAHPDSPGDVKRGGRKLVWVSGDVYRAIWRHSLAHQLTLRQAADDLFGERIGGLRAQVLDVLDPEWRGREPRPQLRRDEEASTLSRASTILRTRGQPLLADVVEQLAQRVAP